MCVLLAGKGKTEVNNPQHWKIKANHGPNHQNPNFPTRMHGSNHLNPKFPIRMLGSNHLNPTFPIRMHGLNHLNPKLPIRMHGLNHLNPKFPIRILGPNHLNLKFPIRMLGPAISIQSSLLECMAPPSKSKVSYQNAWPNHLWWWFEQWFSEVITPC